MEWKVLPYCLRDLEYFYVLMLAGLGLYKLLPLVGRLSTIFHVPGELFGDHLAQILFSDESVIWILQ